MMLDLHSCAPRRGVVSGGPLHSPLTRPVRVPRTAPAAGFAVEAQKLLGISLGGSVG